MPDDTYDDEQDEMRGGFLDRNPTQRETPRLTREWLANQSPDALVNIIFELMERIPKTTGQLNPEAAAALETGVWGERVEELITDYLRLPKTSARREDDVADITWRIKLIPHDPDKKAISLEIYDDVFIGREAGGITPDLDLTPQGAENFGVSRQHALIRPSQDQIYLIDLGSTNGTFHNQQRLNAGAAHALSTGDTISFGGLHFSITIINQPGQ